MLVEWGGMLSFHFHSNCIPLAFRLHSTSIPPACHQLVECWWNGGRILAEGWRNASGMGRAVGGMLTSMPPHSICIPPPCHPIPLAFHNNSTPFHQHSTSNPPASGMLVECWWNGVECWRNAGGMLVEWGGALVECWWNAGRIRPAFH